MRTAILICFLLFYNYCSAQNTIGFSGGFGVVTSFSGSPTPTPEGDFYFLKKTSHRLAAGLSLSSQKYSFNNTIDNGDATRNWSILSVSQNSTYVFLSPKLSVGIGSRQNLNLEISTGAGILCDGRQSLVYMQPGTHYAISGNSTMLYATDIHTSGNVSKYLFRAQVRLTEPLSAAGKFRLCWFQEFSYIPTYISKNTDQTIHYDNGNKLSLRTDYFTLGVTIIHQYKSGKSKKQAQRPPLG